MEYISIDCLQTKDGSKQTSEQTTNEELSNNEISKPKIEYEIVNVSDTIRRRLESPSSTVPDLVQTIKSKETNISDNSSKDVKTKIPIALKSPAPIRKDILKQGNKQQSDKKSTESIVSIESPLSETFNLSEKSELFSRISENKIEINPNSDQNVSNQCHMVEIKETEIIKSKISNPEPMEVYPSSTIETAIHYGPSSVERVEIVDTETESPADSDIEDRYSLKRSQEGLSEWATTQLSKLDYLPRVSPEKSPIGILKRKNSSNDGELSLDIKQAKSSVNFSVAEEVQNAENNASSPQSSPNVDLVSMDIPILHDLDSKIEQLETDTSHKIKDREAVAEYLILDDDKNVDDKVLHSDNEHSIKPEFEPDADNVNVVEKEVVISNEVLTLISIEIFFCRIYRFF